MVHLHDVEGFGPKVPLSTSREHSISQHKQWTIISAPLWAGHAAKSACRMPGLFLQSSDDDGASKQAITYRQHKILLLITVVEVHIDGCTGSWLGVSTERGAETGPHTQGR